MIQLKPVNAALIIGGAIGIATAFVNPVYSGASLAFMGGIIGGASLNSEQSAKKIKSTLEAERVGSTFAALYDRTRGLVDPTELAFLSNCSIDHAHSFLTSLAEEVNGQKIATKEGMGVLFNFPHSQSALDALSKNASNWAQAQNKQLAGELEKHKRAIQVIQAQQAAAQLQAKQEEKADPWNGVAPGL